ncbi:MAG: hypothetical protein V4492_05950 [Chlamydiota bacterium]
MYKSEEKAPLGEDALNEILVRAETAEEPPSEPPGGIPRQWVPFWIRWPVRVLILPFIMLDLFMQKLASMLIRPPFQRAGNCLKRGNCCHYILVPEAKGVLGRIFYFWNTQFLGFYRRTGDVYEDAGKRAYVMGCRYLRKDGSCRHYGLRPTVCRKWPIIEYFGYPRILKGCGFKALPRGEKSPH